MISNDVHDAIVDASARLGGVGAKLCEVTVNKLDFYRLKSFLFKTIAYVQFPRFFRDSLNVTTSYGRVKVVIDE